MQLVVGRIGKAHGVHGEVSVDVRTDDVERRFTPGACLDTEPAEHGPLTIIRVRPHSGRLLVMFDGVVDRAGAEALRGALLVVDSATSAAPTDPEEFWDHDLVGLSVVTATGEPVGTVTEVVHTPAQDLLVVERETGTELLVPFVAELVPTVDLTAAQVVIAPPPGLLDEQAD